MSEGEKIDFALVNAERLRKEAQPALLNEHRHLHGLAKLGEVDCAELERIHKLVVDEMIRRGLEHDSPLECKAKAGLKLNEPHAYLVWKGKKRSIALPAEDGKGLDGYLTGTPLVLCQNGAAGAEAYGEAILGNPAAMTQAQFDLPEYADCHCVRPEERREWWDGVKQFYVYPIKSFAKYEHPRPVLLASGCKCYLPDVRFKQYTPPTAKEQEVLRRSERLPKQIILTPRAVSLTGSMLYGNHEPRDVDVVIVGAEWRAEEGQFVVPLTPTFKEKLERVLRAVYQTGKAVQYISEGEGPTFDHLPLYALALVRLPRLEVEHVSEMEPEMAAVGYDKDGAKFNPGQARDAGGRWTSGSGWGGFSEPHAAKEGWEKNLSTTEKAAAKSYTISDYKKLNTALGNEEELPADLSGKAEALDRVIDKAGSFDEPVTVYRGIPTGTRPLAGHGAELAGMTGDERDAIAYKLTEDWARETFKPGESIQTKTFQSTSFLPDPALDASLGRDTPGVVLEIKASRGAYLDHSKGLSNFDDEAELLLPRGTRYKVVSIVPKVEFESASGRTRPRTVVRVIQE